MNKVVEQAVGNYLIYHDKLFNDCLIKSFNNNGSVMTLALTNNDNIKFDSDNNILNGKGEIASVIHQYERKPDIIRKVKYKFNIDNSKEVKYKTFNIIIIRLKFSLFIIMIFFIIFICLLIIVIISLFRNKKKRKLRLLKKIQLKLVDYKLLKI